MKILANLTQDFWVRWFAIFSFGLGIAYLSTYLVVGDSDSQPVGMLFFIALIWFLTQTTLVALASLEE